MFVPSKQLVYVHIPKCAGCSVRRTLGFGPRMWTPHADAQRIYDLIGQRAFFESWKFTLVRNPWARLVSLYEFNRTKDPMKNAGPKLFMYDDMGRTRTFDQWVRTALADPRRYPPRDWGADTSYGVHLLSPQTEWTLCEGKDSMDFVGRVETFQESMEVVCDEIGLPHSAIPVDRINSSGGPTDYRHFYSDDLAEFVAGYYASDIFEFQYEF